MKFCIFRKKYLLVGIFFASMITIAANLFSIYTYGNQDETRKTDTAIILGAAVWGDEPSPVFRERINYGIGLYHSGYVKNLIFTGGYSEGNSSSDAAVARDYAINQGVLPVDILIEEQSAITQENLYYAKEIMVEHQFKDALIVSDPLHMKRSMVMAGDVGITAYTSPTPTTRYVGGGVKAKFLAREVFFYLGYKMYRFKGGSSVTTKLMHS